MDPKVFISHASEDKERFVLDFATKLRSKGIDAWVDKWEMCPGDSIVDKIFEEGIKNAQAVIVVLSKCSVDKPWVREELNASMVKKINEGSKLIPVIIDDCQVPACLQSIYWVKIKDLNNYDDELDQIVMSIYGQLDKPPMGIPPSYTQTMIDILPGLTKVDSLVIKLSCEEAIKIGYPYYIDIESILAQAKSLGIHPEEFFETLEMLNRKRYIKAKRLSGANIPPFSITVSGFDKYARTYIDDYDSVVKSVAFQIVNLNKMDNLSISASLNQPQMIVDYILGILEKQVFIKVSKTTVERMLIYNVSPKLKRILKRT